MYIVSLNMPFHDKLKYAPSHIHNDKNDIKTAMRMGGILVASWCGSTLYDCMILRMGFIGEARFIAMGRTCAEQHLMEVVSAGRRGISFTEELLRQITSMTRSMRVDATGGGYTVFV